MIPERAGAQITVAWTAGPGPIKVIVVLLRPSAYAGALEVASHIAIWLTETHS